MYNDIRDIRRENARYLLLERANNNQSEFAEIIGRKPSFINQIIGDNPKKVIGGAIARIIERAFGLEPFWLDADHSEIEMTSLSGKSIAVVIQAIQTTDINFELLREVTKVMVRAMGKEVIEKDREHELIEQYYYECKYNETAPNLKRARQIISV